MKKGENIFKRKDGRWEARYIKGYELSGKIKYRFVGYVEIPAAPRHPHYKADTRQGAAVEYLTEPKTA